MEFPPVERTPLTAYTRPAPTRAAPRQVWALNRSRSRKKREELTARRGHNDRDRGWSLARGDDCARKLVHKFNRRSSR